MNDEFERRVRAAAVAGWWVVLVAALLFLASWVAYLAIIPARPEWLLLLWGPGLNWEYVQNVWFWGLFIIKLAVWMMAALALWLTLWARQLRRR